MTWFGSWFGATAGSSSPPPPNFTGTTTVELLRDRIIALIAAIVPRKESRLRFTVSEDLGDADFFGWAEENPDAALRRYQVRTLSFRDTPDVSNLDVQSANVTFRVVVAYPQSGRAGPNNARDRDDQVDQDKCQIESAIGIPGYPNFAAPTNASHLAYEAVPTNGQSCDFLVITLTLYYYRSRIT